MSRRFLNGLFGPEIPRWACEVTPEKAIVVGGSDDRKHVKSRSANAIAPGALVPSLKSKNLVEGTAVRAAVGKSLEEAGFFGSEIVLVVPDDAVRIALLDVESFPTGPDEQRAFIQWKFKKNVPFDVSTARVAWDKLSSSPTIRLLAALTPDSVVREYEEIAESFGLHAGLVLPSTLAALALLSEPEGDMMFIKKSASAITTSVLVDERICFYRKVPVQQLYEAAYPTFVYYQVKLDGKQLSGIVLCGEQLDSEEVAELEQGISGRVGALLPSGIEDTYKPALGALQQ